MRINLSFLSSKLPAIISKHKKKNWKVKNTDLNKDIQDLNKDFRVKDIQDKSKYKE